MISIRFFLLLIFLSSILFSYNACVPKYHLNLHLRLLNQDYLPVPDYTVNVTYQVRSTITSQGEEQYTSIVKLSNSTGDVVFKLYNKEEDPRKLDCKVVVYVTRFGYEKKVVIDLNDISYTIPIFLDVYKLRFYTLSNNTPVEAKVILDNITYTGPNVIVFTPKGYISGYAYYKGVKKFFNISVENNTDFTINLDPFYVNVTVKDDDGKILKDAIIQIDNSTCKDVCRITRYGTIAHIIYNGKTYDFQIYADDNVFEIDTHKPVINNIQTTYNNNTLTLHFCVEDSNLDFNSIDVRAKGEVYLLGNLINDNAGCFNFVLDNVNTTNMTFYISASDSFGNKNTIKVSYNRESTTTEKSKSSTFPGYLKYVLIIIVLIILYIVYKKLKDLLSD